MKWNRSVRVVAVAVMMLAGTAAPSQAREPGNEWSDECNPPASTVLGRGGECREPTLGQMHEDLPAAAKGKARSGATVTVPVYFHVVTDGSIGAVTANQILAQIAVLNNTYAGGEGGARTGFGFELAGATRTNNATWFYANPGGTNGHTMKRNSEGPFHCINMTSPPEVMKAPPPNPELAVASTDRGRQIAPVTMWRNGRRFAPTVKTNAARCQTAGTPRARPASAPARTHRTTHDHCPESSRS